MPDPITFATEAERLAAREQYVAIQCAVFGRVNEVRRVAGGDFDRVAPPVVPPKMVPFELWAVFNDKGEWCGWQWSPEQPTVGHPGYHVYRVRVVVGDE